ncbi:hypothetical protein K438DRAFT_1770880 [Mycena galopus ATCC 62051]|nr:hypothetical protein K438DRAFT_1770880 [Mycena galopus ATCC 62051]
MLASDSLRRKRQNKGTGARTDWLLAKQNKGSGKGTGGVEIPLAIARGGVVLARAYPWSHRMRTASTHPRRLPAHRLPAQTYIAKIFCGTQAHLRPRLARRAAFVSLQVELVLIRDHLHGAAQARRSSGIGVTARVAVYPDAGGGGEGAAQTYMPLTPVIIDIAPVGHIATARFCVFEQ